MLPYHGWLSGRDREEKRLTIPWRTDKEDAQPFNYLKLLRYLAYRLLQYLQQYHFYCNNYCNQDPVSRTTQSRATLADVTGPLRHLSRIVSTKCSNGVRPGAL